MYTQFFTSIANIKNIEELLPGSEKHISCNALLLFIFASQVLPTYSDLDTPLEHCCTILNDNFKEKFCRILKVNERTYKRNIKELSDAHLLILTNKKEHLYAVNPLIASKIGTLDVLRYTRNFWADRNIFSDVCCSNKPKAAEKHCKLFLDINNIGRYSAFVNKKINYTELILFLILAADAGYCNTPNSPEECGKVTLDSQKTERLARNLNIGTSTLYRCIANLCSYHFLHKISGVNGKYMINPFLAAKGDHEKIEKFRNKILPEYFGAMADGDIVVKSDTVSLKIISIYKLTGECVEHSAA